jgi:acyl-CoA thioester hydrolase
MPAIYLHEHTVRDDEIDGQGHANNVSYVHWMQDAAVAHSSAQGWTPERYRDAGIGWVARSHFIEYLRPAFAGDAIVVRTWVSGFERVRSTRRYEMVRADDETVLARAETTWAFLRREDGRPIRIPAEVAEAFVVVEPD